ncbi:MAG: HdeD family acid-resistance protein [Roseibium sp.]
MANSQTVEFSKAVKENSSKIFWIGLMMAAVGLLAIIFPFATSLTANFMIGWVFVLMGFLSISTSFTVNGTGPFFGVFLVGALTIAAGVFLIANPDQGLVILTFIIAIIFMFEGAYYVMAAFELRPEDGWGWMLFSGMISVVVGLMIVAKIHGASLIILGLMVGVNFLSSGISMVMISRAAQKTP